jgi:hypothetical protein
LPLRLERVRNTFEAVPDAPVSSFTLEMQGGGKGLLDASKHHASADLTGHNGKVDDFRPALQAQCPKARKGHKAHKRGSH